jgi:hypothetical protein
VLAVAKDVRLGEGFEKRNEFMEAAGLHIAHVLPNLTYSLPLYRIMAAAEQRGVSSTAERSVRRKASASQ